MAVEIELNIEGLEGLGDFLTEAVEAFDQAADSALEFDETLQEIPEGLDLLRETQEEVAERSAEATIELKREAEAVKELGDRAEEAERKVGRLRRSRALATDPIRAARTMEDLEEAIKATQIWLSDILSLHRALGPRSSLNEMALARNLIREIETQRALISLPVTGTSADIFAVMMMARQPLPLLQRGGFVTSPLGLAEEGEFVVRAEPAKETAPLLQAINRGERPPGQLNFFITVNGEAKGIDWREITRKEIIPEIERAFKRR